MQRPPARVAIDVPGSRLAWFVGELRNHNISPSVEGTRLLPTGEAVYVVAIPGTAIPIAKEILAYQPKPRPRFYRSRRFQLYLLFFICLSVLYFVVRAGGLPIPMP